MTTILNRLTDYPHSAVFDKTPEETLLFRLRHPNGVKWTVADEVMTVNAVTVVNTYNLSLLTVGELASRLTADGYEVTELVASTAKLTALVILEGEGDQGVSNGDRVLGYTSLMWVLMASYAGVLREVSRQVVQALRQMIITQAEGEWLDLWGKLYGIQRRQGEGDTAYQPRIPKEAFRLRESPIAIEEAVKDITGKTIRIEEPWEDVFRLDTSVLSGPDRFPDGERIGYFFIQPTSAKPIDWTDVLPVIERNRAAGIVTLPPFCRIASHTIAGISGKVDFGIISNHLREMKYEDRALLDYSTIEEQAIINHEAFHGQVVSHYSHVVLTGWPDAPWPDSEWSDSGFIVGSARSRSYRQFLFDVHYTDDLWADVAWADAIWEGAVPFEPKIRSAHTRS